VPTATKYQNKQIRKKCPWIKFPTAKRRDPKKQKHSLLK
jgi:hypothetical protein